MRLTSADNTKMSSRTNPAESGGRQARPGELAGSAQVSASGRPDSRRSRIIWVNEMCVHRATYSNFRKTHPEELACRPRPAGAAPSVAPLQGRGGGQRRKARIDLSGTN